MKSAFSEAVLAGLGVATLSANDPREAGDYVEVRTAQVFAAAQRDALVTMARDLAPAVVRSVVETRAVPIAFERSNDAVRVRAGDAAFDVATNIPHSPNCAALKWFEPLGRTEDAEIGVTRSQEWTGTALGPRWKQVSDDKRSSFVGTFSYDGR
jgi:hypothetical protein